MSRGTLANYNDHNCQESKYDVTRCCETRCETLSKRSRSPCTLLLQAAYHHVLSAPVVESANVPVDVKKLARHRTNKPYVSLQPWWSCVRRTSHLPAPALEIWAPTSCFHTHIHTHCLLLLLLQLLWERQHALKSQAGFPEENLVFSPPSSSRHTPNADKGLTQHIDA